MILLKILILQRKNQEICVKIRGGVLMKKIKNMVKKGGVADIVTLMIIVGLVIALIIAVVLPMITQSQQAGGDNSSMIGYTDSFIGSLAAHS